MTTLAPPRPRELWHWLVATAPVLFWMIHLTYMAAVATQADSPTWRWTLYAITPVMGIPTVICLALSWYWLRKYRGGDPGSEEAQLEFVALIGVASGVFNLLLILAEGVLVPILSSRG
jgi:hypothetical protein